MGGGVRNKKGLVGTSGVHTNLAKCGCVRRRSSVRVLRSMTKIPSAVKCKRPTKVVWQPSKKSKARRGTRAPSKYSIQAGGKCPKVNLSESTNEDSR